MALISMGTPSGKTLIASIYLAGTGPEFGCAARDFVNYNS